MRFDQWAQKANAFVGEVAAELCKDKRSAARVTRAVLHALRDRLTTSEAKDLVAQLPMFLKALWAEGWDPTLGPDKSLRSRDDFVNRVMDDPCIVLPRDFPDYAEAEAGIIAVFQVLRRHISPGEARDVAGQLPSEIRGLWLWEGSPGPFEEAIWV